MIEFRVVNFSCSLIWGSLLYRENALNVLNALVEDSRQDRMSRPLIPPGVMAFQLYTQNNVVLYSFLAEHAASVISKKNSNFVSSDHRTGQGFPSVHSKYTVAQGMQRLSWTWIIYSLLFVCSDEQRQ